MQKRTKVNKSLLLATVNKAPETQYFKEAALRAVSGCVCRREEEVTQHSRVSGPGSAHRTIPGNQLVNIRGIYTAQPLLTTSEVGLAPWYKTEICHH